MTATGGAIEIWNRAAGRVETEAVYGEFWLRLAYGSAPGRMLTHRVLARRWLGRLAGRLNSTRGSARRVPRFCERYGIAIDQFEDREWGSFNDFFVRRFRPGARDFCREPDRMPAPAEARYLAFERVEESMSFPVKGSDVDPRAVLDDPHCAGCFEEGPLLIARLAPVDYHRFHFPDGGVLLRERRISGRLHSVNPLALSHRSDILATNERHASMLTTDHFGVLAMVEVGAMNVGRIVQTHRCCEPFQRGGEKGYFCFGASSILLFGEPGRWRPSQDLLEQTAAHRETLVRLGEEIARTP